MDTFGRRGRSNTFLPLFLGTNTGAGIYQTADPAAIFFAGMIATKDPVTDFIKVCTSSAVGAAWGLFGDTRINTPISLAAKERAVVTATGSVKLNNTGVFADAAGTFASIYNLGPSFIGQVLAANVTTIFTTGTADLPRGIIHLADPVAQIATGDVVEVTYYYTPNERHFATGTDELPANGAITIWRFHGEYQVGLFETVSNAGLSGLPVTNDPLYCSANGRFTADPTGHTEVIAICRRGPTPDKPFLIVDLRI